MAHAKHKGSRHRTAMAAALALTMAGCIHRLDDPRAVEVASVMSRADMPLLRTRPSLMAGKYALMATDPYAFFRGSVPLYLHDFRNNRDGIGQSAFASDTPLVLSLGDAHLENFGVLIARDGTLGLEPNDFDGADRTVYLWDVRRLAVTMALVARLANSDDPDARAETTQAAETLAFTAARSYAEAIHAYSNGAPRARVDDPGDNEVLIDAFNRSYEDLAERADLTELTLLENGVRKLRRGEIDPEESNSELRNLPKSFLDALPETLRTYRDTLIDPPPAEFFTILDAAREMGGGVASFPRVRALILVEGRTTSKADDVLLELKELTDSTVPVHPPPEVRYDTVQDRILRTTRAAWSIPDAAPLWGTSDIFGFAVQIRMESAGQKTLRVRRLRGKRGTVAALTDTAQRLGALLARIHAAPEREGATSPASQIAALIGDDLDAFGDDHAAVADRGAALVLEDHERFKKALKYLGPTLGVTPDPSDAPSADLEALYNGLGSPCSERSSRIPRGRSSPRQSPCARHRRSRTTPRASHKTKARPSRKSQQSHKAPKKKTPSRTTPSPRKSPQSHLGNHRKLRAQRHETLRRRRLPPRVIP